MSKDIICETCGQASIMTYSTTQPYMKPYPQRIVLSCGHSIRIESQPITVTSILPKKEVAK